jgi:hypothetical protein
MKKLLFLLSIVTVASTLSAQKDWWEVDIWAVKFKMPESWACDPFSSSSVCDCPGFIIDNGQWDESEYVGMVIYPVDLEEKQLDNRKRVWGGVFQKEGALDVVTFNGIEYQRTEGTLEGLDENKAWQLVSIDKPKKKRKHLIIYFWCHPKIFKQNTHMFERIIATLERTKT